MARYFSELAVLCAVCVITAIIVVGSIFHQVHLAKAHSSQEQRGRLLQPFQPVPARAKRSSNKI